MFPFEHFLVFVVLRTKMSKHCPCVFVPLGLVLVTDAITAMGLPPGRHTLGQQVIEIQGLHAYVAGVAFCYSFFDVNQKDRPRHI